MDDKRISPLLDDEKEFERIIKHFSPMLYAQIRSIVLCHDDTNDVLQNSLLKAWKAFPSFQGNSEISTWLFRIATNESLQHLRNQKYRKYFSLDNVKSVFQLSHTMKPNGGEEDILDKALVNLSPQQRIVFGMRYLNETPFKEIALVMNLAEGTVKATYHQAHKKVEFYLIENAE